MVKIGTRKYDEIKGWEDLPSQTDIKARSDSESSAIASGEATNQHSHSILLNVKGSLKIPETLNIDSTIQVVHASKSMSLVGQPTE